MRVLALAAIAIFSFSIFADIHSSIDQPQTKNSIYSPPSESEPQEPLPPEQVEPPDQLPPQYRTYFDWGRGRDGTGYCYEFFRNGQVANGGRSMPIRFCEEVHPSYYSWGRGRDGYTYCYQFTPYHVVMNQGRAVPSSFCSY